jgi:hypothetical protein
MRRIALVTSIRAPASKRLMVPPTCSGDLWLIGTINHLRGSVLLILPSLR